MKNENNFRKHVNGRFEIATLAGGCFWCLEAIYNEVKGIIRVVPGYSGGNIANPSYEQVCTGTTGHAEVVQITFDPEQISFETILNIFFAIHDPTTLNRQGPDTGTQYRSAIFYHNNTQKRIAEQLIKTLNESDTWNAPIVTEVTPLQVFYEAEEYHKDYFKRNPEQGYCQVIISPKLAKFRKQYLGKGTE